MNSPIKKIFFNNTDIKTFFITRLSDNEIEEEVFLEHGKRQIDITSNHGMICLDPFCVAVWLPADHANLPGLGKPNLNFFKGHRLNASIEVSIIEKIPTAQGALLLYRIENIKNYQLSALHRLVLFAYFLRSKANTYYSRKVISALYSYPRKIIIVSYRDDTYYNIFPMDIQGFIEQENMYILGLRTTNVTLNKILEAKKVVICDTDAVDINTVYNLGKHSSSAPTPKDKLPFGTSESELFGFPVPDFTGSYKEIEIIYHKKMGYHMLMVGKVVNSKKIKHKTSSLYHVGFLQFQKSNYQSIDGLF
ncbi:MAG: oxidoreductase RutF, flavin reductase family [Mucilaginibacter sp.]|nr:oxidoreductase RutF, flavin reductase family [Mucilaginibacter sp.]